MASFKSEPGLGLIDPGDTPLSTDLQWEVFGNRLRVSGAFVDAAGRSHDVASEFELEDGDWAIALGVNAQSQTELRLVSVPSSPQPGFELITLLAGYGSGIRVENGEIVGDVYVLTVNPA